MIANKTVSSIKKVPTGQLIGVPMALYIVLVLLGILGNAMVILVVGNSIIREPGRGRNSDLILVNMALTNLLVSVMRNTLLVTSDFNLEVQGMCVLGAWGIDWLLWCWPYPLGTISFLKDITVRKLEETISFVRKEFYITRPLHILV